MSALVPIEQKRVMFYEDEVTAVLVEVDGKQRVYIPLRPIVERLGLDWSAQTRRIGRDPVLSSELMSVVVMATDIDPESKRPKSSQMVCLPLDFLNGFLFGISAERVRAELREQVIRYQRECYRVLAEAFRADAAISSATALVQIREVAASIVRVMDEVIRVENRVTVSETRLDEAARVVGNMSKRLRAIEQRVAPGEVLTKEQAYEVQDLVKRISEELARHDPSKAHYAEVYRALSLQTKRAKYEDIPQGNYEKALQFLSDWLMVLLEK